MRDQCWLRRELSSSSRLLVQPAPQTACPMRDRDRRFRDRVRVFRLHVCPRRRRCRRRVQLTLRRVELPVRRADIVSRPVAVAGQSVYVTVRCESCVGCAQDVARRAAILTDRSATVASRAGNDAPASIRKSVDAPTLQVVTPLKTCTSSAWSCRASSALPGDRRRLNLSAGA